MYAQSFIVCNKMMTNVMPSSQYGRHWGYYPDSGGFGTRHRLAGASIEWAPRGIRNWSIHNSTNTNADQVQVPDLKFSNI